MKHISILIPKGHTSLVNIEGSYQMLSEVNALMAAKGKQPLFNIQLVGLSHKTSQRNGLFTIQPNALISDVKKTDLIIIPSLHGDQKEAAALNKDFIPWIINQYNCGAEVASLCIGAFFLAATGLLNGRSCTTHWQLANEFKNMFPDANLIQDKIITDEKGIYTSGGAYSYLNLMVYLTEKYAGRDMAIQIAKGFAIDIERVSQSAFIIFEGQKAHNDDQIKKVQAFIESNYHEKLTIEQLAKKFSLAKRSLERRFKLATNNTIIEYLQRVKIEAAKRSFETSRKNITEVMYETGYTDTKAFRDVFKKITGLTPLDYRNKYHKQEMMIEAEG